MNGDKNMPKVSIIIPVYNAEAFLERCLDSLLSQTLTALEIIAVDDGSIDRSPEILDCYAGKYRQIKVIHTNNGGVSAARNTGLAAAEGDFIAGKLEEQGIKNSFLRIKGETRSCMAFITKDMCQTEVLEPGPSIQEHEMEEWIKLYHKLIEESSIICASGSLPKGLSSSFYNQIIKIANKKNTRLLLDTSGEALAKSIEAKPYFIKPNIDELKMLSGESINSMSDVEKVIDRLQNYGIEFIIVSLGEKGALAAFKGNKYRINIPYIQITADNINYSLLLFK
jgi:tagatose 6-phosphate kinase